MIDPRPPANYELRPAREKRDDGRGNQLNVVRGAALTRAERTSEVNLRYHKCFD